MTATSRVRGAWSSAHRRQHERVFHGSCHLIGGEGKRGKRVRQGLGRGWWAAHESVLGSASRSRTRCVAARFLKGRPALTDETHRLIEALQQGISPHLIDQCAHGRVILSPQQAGQPLDKQEEKPAGAGTSPREAIAATCSSKEWCSPMNCTPVLRPPCSEPRRRDVKTPLAVQTPGQEVIT